MTSLVPIVTMAPYPSGKGEVCKTFMPRFESARRLLRKFPPDTVRLASRGGGIGRRTGLKILSSARDVPVQVRPSVHNTNIRKLITF